MTARWARLRAWTLLVLATTVVAGALAGARPAEAADAALVVAALNVLEQNYVDQVNPVGLLNAALGAVRDGTHQSAAAVPDQGQRPTGAVRDALAPPLGPVDRAVRAVDVRDDSAGMGAVSNPAQPVPHDLKRGIAGQEARDGQHRRAVAARHALAAVDGIHDKPSELELPAHLGEVIAPPALGRRGRRRLRLGIEGGTLDRLAEVSVEGIHHAPDSASERGAGAERLDQLTQIYQVLTDPQFGASLVVRRLFTIAVPVDRTPEVNQLQAEVNDLQQQILSLSVQMTTVSTVFFIRARDVTISGTIRSAINVTTGTNTPSSSRVIGAGIRLVVAPKTGPAVK